MSAVNRSLFPRLPIEIDEKILVCLGSRDLARARGVNTAWREGEAMALEMAKRPRFVEKCERSFQKVMAYKKLNEMEKRLMTKAKWATCGSICLWPCTVPATLVGALSCALVCNWPWVCGILNWWPCTAEDGMEGPMAGTDYPVLNPWTPVAVSTKQGRHYTLLSKEAQQRIPLLEEKAGLHLEIREDL